MKNLSVLLLIGLLWASVAADDDSNEFESDEILLEVVPAEPVVSQYSSLSNVVQQNERKAQPIEIITPFGYQGIFDQPQQYLSSESIQALRQYFPALFTAFGQTNGRLQSIQHSHFSQPAVVSQVQSTFNPDGTFFLNRNVVPVSGVSNIGGGQQASGVVGVNQPDPASLQFNFRANQNKQGIQSVSGYLPAQQLTFGSAPSFVPKQSIPIKASFSQLGINLNQPQRNQFSTSQSISTTGQNNIVPAIESHRLVSPVTQQSSFTIGGQTFQIPVTAEQQFQGIRNQQPLITQQFPASGSKPLGFFLSTVRQPSEQSSIVAQNSVLGQGTFSARPQVLNQQSSTIPQQAFRQPFTTAQQVPLAQSSLFGHPTFGHSSAIGQQSVGQTSSHGQQATFGQPSAAGQQTFGLSSSVGQQTFGQNSGAGQQATFGQPSAAGQQTFGLSSTVGQQTFGQTSVSGQQSTFGQPSAAGQQTFGQPSVTGQQTFGLSSTAGQQTFGQTSGAEQQTTFGQTSVGGQQAFGQSTFGQQTFGQNSGAGQQATFGQPSTAGQQAFEQSSTTGQQTFGQNSGAGQQTTFGQPSITGQQAVGQQAFNDNSFQLSQPQAVEQESRFSQPSFGAAPATFSSPASFSQPAHFQTEGQTLFAPQFESPAPQPISVNQPTFGALRSDSTTLDEQSSFGINESSNFGSSAAFKTDVAKVSQGLDYDVSVGNAKFNSGLDFDESESFDTKVYDQI